MVDNCEHVVDSAAAVIDALIAACPSLVGPRHQPGGARDRRRARRRGPLARPGDDRGRAVPAAGDGGRCRARIARSHSTIEHICGRLDGIPLAIELAAARAATLGVPPIVGDARRSVHVCSAAVAGGRSTATARCARRSTGRTGCSTDDEQRLFQLAGGVLQRLRARRRRSRRRPRSASTSSTPPITSHRSCTRAWSRPRRTARGVRHRMLETMRAFAARAARQRDERLAAMRRALADWMATITDLPFDDPCSAAGRAELDPARARGRQLARRDRCVAAAVRDGELAARLCGPPVAYFLLGRHDLADFVRPAARPVRAGTGASPSRAVRADRVRRRCDRRRAQLQAWADEMQAHRRRRADRSRRLDAAGLRWRGSGDFDRLGRRCARRRRSTRGLPRPPATCSSGIAALDHFSLTDADRRSARADRARARGRRPLRRGDPPGHLPARRGVGTGRRPSRTVRSSSCAGRSPTSPTSPALTRLTLPGSASRLLARLDPARRGAGTARADRRDAGPTIVRRPDPVVLRGSAAAIASGHPAAGVGAGDDVGVADRAVPVDDGLRRPRPPGIVDEHAPVSLEELETMVRAH